MTTITTTIKSPRTFADITIDIKVSNGAVAGTANGYAVSDTAVVQGKKALRVTGGNAPYIQITDALYAQIESARRATRFLSARQKAQEDLDAAEATYLQLLDTADSNADIIRARDARDAAERVLAAMPQ